jgi:hypothetical protein
MKFDATKKLPGEDFKRPWPPLIKMDEAVQKRIDGCLEQSAKNFNYCGLKAGGIPDKTALETRWWNL